MWTPVEGAKKGWRESTYGMGWQTVQEKSPENFCRASRGRAYHTGAAVGASSILLILPQNQEGGSPPKGVVVALMTNMISVNLSQAALEIAELFEGSQ